MSSVATSIIKRIRAKQRGWVFTPKDFLDFGTRASVDQTLSRLVKQGTIRRLDRGVYDYPKQHDLLGTLAPDSDSLAQAVTSRTDDVIFPSGALAANLMGLSTQVPAKVAYLTNGRSRVRTVAGRTLTFRHARVPLLSNQPQKVNLMLQALSYLGKDSIDDDIVMRCAKRLDDRDMKALSTAAAQVPSWLADVFKKIQHVKHADVHSKT